MIIMKSKFVELKKEELKEIQGGFPWLLIGVAFLIGAAWAYFD